MESPTTTVFRSLLLALPLATLGAVRAGSAAPAGYYADQKVVHHNVGGGPDGAAYFKRLLGNLRNHVEAIGKEHADIRVVSLGEGGALFQAAIQDKGLAERIDTLRAAGIRFLICANTLRERKIDHGALYGVGEDDTVPSGVAEFGAPAGHGIRLHPSLARGEGEVVSAPSRQRLASMSAWLTWRTWSPGPGPKAPRSPSIPTVMQERPLFYT